MVQIHKLAGFVVVAVFAVGWIWGLAAWATKRGPGEGFWTWVTVVQVLAGLQAIGGIVVFASGHRALTALHYAYGFFPIAALAGAHLVARRPDYRERPWVPFAWVAFISFGLTLRAVMTGFSG